jgi:hypothetical protein
VGLNKGCFADFWGFRLASPIHKEYSMGQYIGAVITESKIFALPCLLPINLAGMGGNGNKIFTGKGKVQNENNP